MRLRPIPLVLAAGTLLLTVRVGGIWQELSVTAGRPGFAQSGEAAAGAPAEQEPASAGAAAAAETGSGSEAAAGEGPSEAAPTETADGAVEVPAETPILGDPFALTDEELEVLQSLARRRAELEERERGLGEREALLAAAERRLDDKIAELKALQQAVADLMQAKDEEEAARIAGLVKIYENMKPKDAAAIFDELDLDTVLKVIGRMRAQKTAPILAAMDPDKARQVTDRLARREALAPPE